MKGLAVCEFSTTFWTEKSDVAARSQRGEREQDAREGAKRGRRRHRPQAPGRRSARPRPQHRLDQESASASASAK